MSHPPRKIAIFGGTFDPVHLGHIHLAGLAKAALGLDEVRFLPCRISPHKTASIPTSGGDRYEMLRLATAEIPWAVVDDYELHQPGPSYSFETAEAMARKFPAARLFWIMGGDQWEALPRWKHPERLAKTVEFIVLARGDAPQPRDGYRFHLVHGEHPASATAIRKVISNSDDALKWLDPAVVNFIQHHRLYRP
ncbi:MAG: nicotinate (nicotinamide) nucleotide adenylyltransferase [Akkermansiaceae bacterium]|nr:nicotinate (nicotinamide) nucleotide adenylyltransferase [Akkermansiaceae bacterium]